MTSRTDQALEVTGGVDTHGETHHAAVIDHLGRHLADRKFPATGAGYRRLPAWLRPFGSSPRPTAGTGRCWPTPPPGA
ncbi:hypothetical protein [Streptomyces sp. NPDC057386]|uniref:hypothetical protein n=1 Tax=unclassified Streptomyces TaxID=2593676 RepID=UPI003642BCBA